MTTASTRILLSTSAAYLAALGVLGSFLPREILVHVSSPAGWVPELVMQLAAAGWLALAVLNWAARGSLLGGIYGRPIALANFAQFAIGAITLLKQFAHVRDSPALVGVTAVSTLFAVWFGYVLFGPGPRPR
jgi:hypothetical protein